MLKGEEDIRRLGGIGLLIADSHGIHFLIRDIAGARQDQSPDSRSFPVEDRSRSCVRNVVVLPRSLALAPLAASAQELPVIELTAGMHRIEAEVVNTQATRMVGLMMRQYDADAARHAVRLRCRRAALHVDEEHADAAFGRLPRRTGPHHQRRGNAAADRRQPLRRQAGAICARDERRLVQEARPGPGRRLAGIDRAPPPR